jgi:hypothetical protein
VTDKEILDGLPTTPFKMGGREPGIGLDCFGLGLIIDRRRGLDVPDFGSPDSEDKFDVIHKTIIENSQWFVQLDKPEKWCWVTFMLRKRLVTHIGRVIDYPYFIHIMSRSLVTIERLDEPPWSAMIEGFYKWEKDG